MIWSSNRTGTGYLPLRALLAALRFEQVASSLAHSALNTRFDDFHLLNSRSVVFGEVAVGQAICMRLSRQGVLPQSSFDLILFLNLTFAVPEEVCPNVRTRFHEWRAKIVGEPVEETCLLLGTYSNRSVNNWSALDRLEKP